MNRQPGILCLDDEQNVLNALRRLFQEEDALLEFTTSPEAALERIRSGDIAVAISDYRMPTMTGIQFLERVKQVSPETVRVLLTGHADVKIAKEAINLGAVYRFLTKPWDDGELLHAVRQAVAHHTLVTENRQLTDLTLSQNRELKDLNGSLEQKVRERTVEIEALNKKLEKSFLGSVRVMAGLAEVHSKVIGSHSRRVAEVSKGIASRLGLVREEVFQVEVAALLHDVGKMAISLETLVKAEAALVPGEVEHIRRHPVMGETLVRMVPNMEGAARLVRHHHELFGGGGFPDGLQGGSIPLGSRIIAVADAFDNALNVRNGYQSGSPQKAFKQVCELTGREFDPKVVEALEAYLKGDVARAEAGEVEVELSDLRAGMVTSRNICNSRGQLLLPARTTLDPKILKVLLGYPDSGRSEEGIFIYRADPSRPPKGT